MEKTKSLKVKPRIVKRDDGVDEILRPEHEYQAAYREACRLLQNDEYVKRLVRRIKEDFFFVGD